MKPIVLVAATSHWFPTARLAMALADAGCVVEGVCPVRHPLRKTSAVSRTHHYNGLAPLKSFLSAIKTARPTLIVPGDDLATHHLHHLFRQQLGRGKDGAETCSLIEHSLGSAKYFDVVYQRATLMKLAAEQGVRAPQSAAVACFDDIEKLAGEIGFPMVLKADGTSGGDGVRIVHSLDEARKAYRSLEAPVQLARAIKRALVDYDKSLVLPSVFRHKRLVSGQAFIAGHEATSTVACWGGEVLAALHFEVINKRHQAGPATVVRLIDHPEMKSAVEKLVRRLKLSGLHGFDYMIEAGTGNAYLVEINPRVTQVGHLALGPGRDLPAALTAAISRCAPQPLPQVTDKDMIALFPQEWMRDPSSSYMASAYHDVPWNEPSLFEVCVRHARTYHARSRRIKGPNSLSPAAEHRFLPLKAGIPSERVIGKIGESPCE